MSNGPTFDPSIPVLTEVFKEQPVLAPGAGPADLPPSSEPATIVEEADPQWEMLEQRLVERIMQRLQEELRDSLPRIVAEAVAAEVAQLKSLSK